MKISEITLNDVKEYINAPDETDRNVQMLIDASKKFILGRTGIKEDKLDNYEDLTMVLLILCSDLYDQRQFMLDSNNGVPLNVIVESILNMHSFNLV